MGVRLHLIAALTASVLGLGHASADPAPGWVVLKISRVEVKPRKIDGSPWDLPREKTSGSCGPVAMIGKMAAGMAGGVIATFLCSHSTPGQRDVSAPDLFVQLVAGDARYRTPVALDTYAEAFDFPVIVPLEGIPPAGLEVQVLDQDDDVGTGELIGMVRLTRMHVQGALASSVPLLTLTDSQLSKIEIEVARYSAPSSVESSTFEVNHEPAALPIRARAGELVTIAARGKYSVASKFREIDQNYEDLRHGDYQTPRILVVVFVPEQVEAWTSHTEQELTMRYCAYWASLRGLPPSSNQYSTTAYLPRAHVFNVAGLGALMDRIGRGETP